MEGDSEGMDEQERKARQLIWFGDGTRSRATLQHNLLLVQPKMRVRVETQTGGKYSFAPPAEIPENPLFLSLFIHFWE